MKSAHLNVINELVREIIHQPHAYMEIIFLPEDKKHCDIMLHLGIKGPLQYTYFEYLVDQVLYQLSVNSKKIFKNACEINKRDENIIHFKHVSLEYFLGKNAGFKAFLLEQKQNSIKKKVSYRFNDSQEVYDDLKLHQQLKPKYSNWLTKEVGCAKGVILIGKSKQQLSKKIYVKKIISFYESLDYSVFKIGKACGASVPTVKYHLTQHACYLFSRSLDNPRSNKPNKQYSFLELKTYFLNPNHYFHYENFELYLNRNEVGDFAEIISLNKANIAKFFLICLIIVISHQNGVKKAKLGLVDFEVKRNFNISEWHDLNGSLKDMLMTYFTKYVTCFGYNNFYLALIKGLEQEDFILAFAGLNENFIAEFEKSSSYLDEILMNMQEQSMIKIKRLICQNWLTNFELIRDSFFRLQKGMSL
jgi:hypothetical protein